MWTLSHGPQFSDIGTVWCYIEGAMKSTNARNLANPVWRAHTGAICHDPLGHKPVPYTCFSRLLLWRFTQHGEQFSWRISIRLVMLGHTDVFKAHISCLVAAHSRPLTNHSVLRGVPKRSGTFETVPWVSNEQYAKVLRFNTQHDLYMNSRHMSQEHVNSFTLIGELSKCGEKGSAPLDNPMCSFSRITAWNDECVLVSGYRLQEICNHVFPCLQWYVVRRKCCGAIRVLCVLRNSARVVCIQYMFAVATHAPNCRHHRICYICGCLIGVPAWRTFAVLQRP